MDLATGDNVGRYGSLKLPAIERKINCMGYAVHMQISRSDKLTNQLAISDEVGGDQLHRALGCGIAVNGSCKTCLQRVTIVTGVGGLCLQ